MFYMLLGGAPLALCYKAVNTMDSMVGYKNERYLYFGRAAAKLDDAANYLPARMAALLLAGAAALTGQDARGALRIWRRDRRSHASPNSAQTEAVMAGALGVQLAGPASYFGKLYEKPTIGDALRAGGAGEHPAGKPDAVCRRDAVHGAAGLRARCGVPAAGAVTEGGERMELTHGGDWAGYAAQYGGMPLDFSANVSRWVCRRACGRLWRGRWTERTVTRTRCAGHCGKSCPAHWACRRRAFCAATARRT